MYSILNKIGYTSMVSISSFDNPDNKIFAKAEYMNPGGSIWWIV